MPILVCFGEMIQPNLFFMRAILQNLFNYLYIYKSSAMKWNKIDHVTLHFKGIVYILFFLIIQLIQVNSARLPSPSDG